MGPVTTSQDVHHTSDLLFVLLLLSLLCFVLFLGRKAEFKEEEKELPEARESATGSQPKSGLPQT